MLWSILLKSPFKFWHEPGYESLSAWQFIQNTLWVTFLVGVQVTCCTVPTYYALGAVGFTRVVLVLAGTALTLMFLTHCVKTVWSRDA